MTHVAVARGGWGSVWRFASRREAFLHPLVQYGDPIMAAPSDVLDNYRTIEWWRIARLAEVVVTTPPKDSTHRDALRICAMSAHTVWEGLLRVAQDPPTDHQRICEMVSTDRLFYFGDTKMAKKQHHAEVGTVEPESGETTATEKAPAKIGAKGPRGISQDAVITLGEDKAGVKYGPENNPKRPGSKTFDRFVEYRDGMTIAEALDRGITSADLEYDKNKGFISITAGTPAELEVSEAA